MNSNSIDRQQQLVRELLDLLDESRDRSARIEQESQEQTDRIRARLSSRQQEVCRKLIQRHDALESDYQQRLYTVRETTQTETQRVDEELQEKLTSTQRQAKVAISDGEYDWFLAKQRLQKDYEADRQTIRNDYKDTKSELKQHGAGFRELVDQAKNVLARHRCELKAQGGDLLEEPDDSDHLAEHFRISGQIQELVLRFQRTFWVRFTEERWALIVFLVVAVICLYPLHLLFGQFVVAGVATLVVACMIALATGLVARTIATKAAHQFRSPLVNAIVSGKLALLSAQAQSRRHRDAALGRLREQRDAQLQELDEGWDADAERIRGQSKTRQTELRVWANKRQLALTEQQRVQEEALVTHFQPRLDDLRKQMESAKQQLGQDGHREVARVHAETEARLSTLAERWKDRVKQTIDEADAMWTRSSVGRVDLEHVELPDWLPSPASDAVRFGSFELTLGSLLREASGPRFEIPEATLRFPLGLDLRHAPSMMLESRDDPRGIATTVLRTAMLRLLTTLPPGKVRFTIIDPVGLGENFSAFMHLADHDEQLVNHRIWTEPVQINARLTELTQHMENVIQTYLRNEFPSIQDYNQNAGEVAEPFRVLVVANFPHGFSEEASQRLRSIVTSGPRCGVFTLFSVDSKQSMPRNLDLVDFRNHANVLVVEKNRLAFADEPLSRFAIQLEQLPDDARVNDVLHAVGSRAKDASRVEVPFSAVAPQARDRWTGDSRKEISVALGRAGATKLQALRLGQGTSQHVLISGKTGSGKSTLLHALITNLALHYSPDEVQFYMIDFKKGVEFKAYAEHALPHARVIAIESEREFGQSVLQRLDVELRRRGDLFRRVRVQSLAGYRDARPDEPLPRILLVIDEFQEFFVKEDKIAQDASLLLDRLVRQGRAFGIHVLLGSQTLAGAYSLARATIGQMAVRIALQCSATDAHLILSDDNDAARLLRRPGEAIYNDANGMVEGNHPFQVVWLSDMERENYLHELAAMQTKSSRPLEAPIVFEGNVAADLARNELLGRAWSAPAPDDIPLAPRAWVGEAIAIKEAPAAVFHRRSGGNLMIVGHQEEAALGIMASSLLSLAAFSPHAEERRSRFLVLDGTRPESVEAGFWTRFAETTDIAIELAKPREGAAAIRQVHDELQRRINDDRDDLPAVFVIIHNLSRFRDLQKSEDDFGLGNFGESSEPSSAEQLAMVLREGPSRGVHTLVWSDTYTNVTRWLDRQSLRDLELRVLFQMSATDSSNLMDSSAAARLGPHRAILYSEDQGVAERFRPYGIPTDELLLKIRHHSADPQRSNSTSP